MKFHVRHDPIHQRVNVYCELNPDPEHDGERIFLTRGDEGIYRGGHEHSGPPTIHRVAMGAEPPLWDWFPEQAIEPLVKALAPRPEASERHLSDALTVRDRLLTILESEHLHGADDPGTEHIVTEADRRRTYESRERR
jgi:hypothetical protein